MKRSVAAIVGFLMLIVAIQSCDSRQVLDENKEINNFNWKYDQPQKFEVNISDTVSHYNLYVNIRHSFYFDWRNIYVKIKTTLPNDTTFERRVNLPLSEAEGKWYGNCIGENCTLKIPIQSNAKLPMKGKYTFEISQDMRINPLPKIKAVGMRIEKVQQQD